MLAESGGWLGQRSFFHFVNDSSKYKNVELSTDDEFTGFSSANASSSELDVNWTPLIVLRALKLRVVGSRIDITCLLAQYASTAPVLEAGEITVPHVAKSFEIGRSVTTIPSAAR